MFYSKSKNITNSGLDADVLLLLLLLLLFFFLR